MRNGMSGLIGLASICLFSTAASAQTPIEHELVKILACDIASGFSQDLNNDGLPDDCQCLADVNADAIVNVNDILTLIANWGTNSPIGDVNFDGTVSIPDLLLVIGAWGACP